MSNTSAQKMIQVDFSKIPAATIPAGCYVYGFDINNSGKLSKKNSAGTVTVIEGSTAGINVESFSVPRTIAQGTGTVTVTTVNTPKLIEITTLLDYGVGFYQGAIGRYNGTTQSCVYGYNGGSFQLVATKSFSGRATDSTNKGFEVVLSNITATSFDVTFTMLGAGLNVVCEIDVLG